MNTASIIALVVVSVVVVGAVGWFVLTPRKGSPSRSVNQLAGGGFSSPTGLDLRGQTLGPRPGEPLFDQPADMTFGAAT